MKYENIIILVVLFIIEELIFNFFGFRKLIIGETTTPSATSGETTTPSTTSGTTTTPSTTSGTTTTPSTTSGTTTTPSATTPDANTFSTTSYTTSDTITFSNIVGFNNAELITIEILKASTPINNPGYKFPKTNIKLTREHFIAFSQINNFEIPEIFLFIASVTYKDNSIVITTSPIGNPNLSFFSWNQYGLKMKMKNVPKNYINNNMIIENMTFIIDNVEFLISKQNTSIFNDNDKSVFFKDLELKKVISQIRNTHYTIDRIKVKVSNDKNIYIFFNGYINIDTMPFDTQTFESMSEKDPSLDDNKQNIINLYTTNINKINIKDNFEVLDVTGKKVKTISNSPQSVTHGRLLVDNGYLNPITNKIIIDNLIILVDIVGLDNSLYEINTLSFPDVSR